MMNYMTHRLIYDYCNYKHVKRILSRGPIHDKKLNKIINFGYNTDGPVASDSSAFASKETEINYFCNRRR
jgi:hypothetical protein